LGFDQISCVNIALEDAQYFTLTEFDNKTLESNTISWWFFPRHGATVLEQQLISRMHPGHCESCKVLEANVFWKCINILVWYSCCWKFQGHGSQLDDHRSVQLTDAHKGTGGSSVPAPFWCSNKLKTCKTS
jgi:hypothetical protein